MNKKGEKLQNYLEDLILAAFITFLIFGIYFTIKDNSFFEEKAIVREAAYLYDTTLLAKGKLNVELQTPEQYTISRDPKNCLYKITEKTINIQTYFCTQSKDKEKYSEIFTEGSYKLKKNE
ncbi:MAG TPA: hypothetical protein VJB89_02905 [Candidatus Nanoarchaeia archaeon]|nr:hypothetical protein [Candidatus Nanoarchaeia archaeon]